MIVTRICKVTAPRNTELDTLMRIFNGAIRYAFNRLLEEKDSKELIKILQPRFRLNKRYAEDAVLQAQAVISSQKELLPAYVEHTKVKLEKTLCKIADYENGVKTPKKVDISICLNGLAKRKEKLEQKITECESHLEKGTIPKVIFGGRKNFIKRMKRRISNEEWKNLRSKSLYSRGDRSKNGNLNMRIVYQEDTNTFVLEIANPLLREKEKRIAPRIVLPIHIPGKWFNEITDVVMGTQVGVGKRGKPISTYIPYTMECIRKNDTYYVHISYDEKTTGKTVMPRESLLSDRIAGIDMNIDRIAVSILSKQGNFLGEKTFYMHDLRDVSSNKRNNIIGETVKEVMDWLRAQNVGAIVMEDLKFAQEHDTNKCVNRATASFAYKKMSNVLIARAMRNGYTVKKVNPAYTSVIGRFKYAKKYGLSVHEAASFVIGRRGLGLNERLSKEVLKLLREKVKSHLIAGLASMEESEKTNERGKKRQRLGMYLRKIEMFKNEHEWSLWNIVNQMVKVKHWQYELQSL
ncbi:IS200/IS605 family accessory protein TnpB-related protein [Bacillus sp. DX4.1]|uniref:IS200/IS605 family accessory protein TnpB-related protein n=1 Tax=Bacillus sp. DX4.1 TaxID=3055867 RepID=UPI0025A03380|nr:IS200/IS605 family accessory protein TnpB-related protein [Bacillus sp. DX4.1]MDM5187416.1 IS200/IS605 family accessory protein TnpB-related protein [Bacillus sp. DX4.1]